ncbi:MAG: type III-B CRISPR module RAMP protein Cmr1 [Anaerolineaceae bacterium]|nr:type III-B CRISPR module RAMP protein Cmr1 [Anaerolineaceae bacterium]
MPQLRLTVQSITPLLMYGADNKDDPQNASRRAEPELRAPSIRGMLRYWLRAVLGAKIPSTSQVFEAESAILGSTGKGSRVRVHVAQSSQMQPEDKLTVLPKSTHGHTLLHRGFPANSEFRLTLSTHLLDGGAVFSADHDLMKAIFLMVHFGGLGRRSRRGSGNLLVHEVKGYDGDPQLDELCADHDDLARYLQLVSEYVTPLTQTVGSRPNFPVFAPDTAVALLGQETHQDYESAFNELWSVSGSYHHEGGIFGDIENKKQNRQRRGSAIQMRVAATQAGFIAQQTILYNGSGQWRKMQEYVEHCRIEGFTVVYGDWRSWK